MTDEDNDMPGACYSERLIEGPLGWKDVHHSC